MGKYGISAIKAVSLIKKSYTKNPKEAWEKATIKVFKEGSPGQKKGCPRETFLSLCKEGLVKGIGSDDYTSSVKNREYAIDAVNILKKLPEISFPTEKELWKMIT